MLLEPRELVIIGNFNIHVDITSDPLSLKVSDCLVSLGLQQHIHKPTHRANHTLNLVISHNDASMVSDLKFGELAILDHSLILFSLAKPPLTKKVISFRKVKSIIKEAFLSDINNSQIILNPPSSLPELVHPTMTAYLPFLTIMPQSSHLSSL